MTDMQMIAAIKEKDEVAINHAINKYSKLLWSIASAVLKNVAAVEDVEECVADVFVYLWQNPEKFDASKGKLKAWLCILARSQAIDRYRKLSKQCTVPLNDTLLIEQIGLDDGILAEETKQGLMNALQSLGQPEQEIIIRRFYYEQKPKEIAIALDMSIKQVENHLYRTKRKLRSMITSE